ncbi:arrestin [Xylaria flabelliformis]|nr:arrestin [Xylaria flabelliformis]
MGSNLDNVANLPLNDPPPKSSFFSRLTAPIRSRSRNLADFHIRLKEPHRQYSAGDHVHGFVILSVVKPIRVTHLTVTLHGYVRAFKNASAAAQLASVNPAVISHGGRNGRYHGNGHASLFQDEIVLCGEGRLEASRWEFEFDLQFPDLELPSSIDFERGTIGYFVTATLTRPTAIAPTSSCEARVSLVEKVDVGLVGPPRERKVFLQTMKRRAKKGKAVAAVVTSAAKGHPPWAELAEPLSDRESTRATESPNDSAMNLSNPTPAGVEDIPHNTVSAEVQSEISGESVPSNHSASYSVRGADVSGESNAGSKHSGHDEREITATVELLKGGCLPGDLVPVKIRVEHNRYMKSLHGIIVTLYRQGRVDYAPPISSFTGLSEEDAKKLERDEYYPRSKTGLGGLSLSSAGSCSVFRKDLSQAVAPLIVDPSTLTANITTAVRVPEDAFPSIRNVPGGLITFKYHVEVIVDLGGKLVGPSSGATPSQQPNRIASSASVRGTYGIDMNLMTNWNGAIVDTDHIRRQKGVISVSFEVVVGTTDSSRSRGKAAIRPSPLVQAPSQVEPSNEQGVYDYDWQNAENGDVDGQEEYDSNGFHQPQSQYYSPVTSPQTAHYDFQPHETQVPIYVPPPEVTDEDNLTDKERARRAEHRLLPSQPSSQNPEAVAGPSQPLAPNQTPYLAAYNPSPSGSRPVPTVNGEEGDGPSAPALEDLGASSSRHHTTDKQELERQRLLTEASAPPDIPDDYDGEEFPAPNPNRTALPRRSHEPSAPILDEDNGHNTADHYDSMIGTSNSMNTSEPLPRYER